MPCLKDQRYVLVQHADTNYYGIWDRRANAIAVYSFTSRMGVALDLELLRDGQHSRSDFIWTRSDVSQWRVVSGAVS